MVKRNYNITLQENRDFCMPSVFQAIMRKYDFELTQEQIAREVNFSPEKLVYFEDCADFFKKRNLQFNFYHYNQTPWNDHEILVSEAFEKGQDLVVAYESPKKLSHAHLALDFSQRQLIMQDPGNFSIFSFDIYELERKMWADKVGVYGLVGKL